MRYPRGHAGRQIALADRIGATAHVVAHDDAVSQRLMPASFRARLEQALLFTMHTWEVNCLLHVTQRFQSVDVAAMVESRHRRIAALEHEIERLNYGRAG